MAVSRRKKNAHAKRNYNDYFCHVKHGFDFRVTYKTIEMTIYNIHA